jgi:hypothetical protein
MLRQDHATLATHLREIDDGIELVVVLMQSQPVIGVDMARLDNLPGVRVHPASIMPGPSGHHSYRTATTFLTLEADTPEDAFERLKTTASAIGDAGDFLPINLERVRAELFR